VVSILRGLSGAPTISFQAVLASEPNTVVIDVPDLELKSVDIDIATIEGECGYFDVFSEPFPGGSMNPSNFPGLHKT
jgi:hypothetical protein